MRKRSKMPARRSRRVFSKHAVRVNRRNVAPAPMRGGIRL